MEEDMAITHESASEIIRHKMRMELDKAILKAQMESTQRINPVLARIDVLEKEKVRRNKQMAALTAAIQADLAAIRSRCIGCDCPENVPSGSCPNNPMGKTMGALVQMSLDNAEGE